MLPSVKCGDLLRIIDRQSAFYDRVGICVAINLIQGYETFYQCMVVFDVQFRGFNQTVVNEWTIGSSVTCEKVGKCTKEELLTHSSPDVRKLANEAN